MTHVKSREVVLAIEITDELLNALNALFKDDLIWIVQVSPIGQDGKDVTKTLFDNAVEFTFDKSAGPGGPAREAKTLVTRVEAAQRQQRALGFGEKRARIVGRIALVVDEPCAGQLPPGVHLLSCVAHARDRARNIDEDRVARRR